jgi:hypothetical protein
VREKNEYQSKGDWKNLSIVDHLLSPLLFISLHFPSFCFLYQPLLLHFLPLVITHPPITSQFKKKLKKNFSTINKESHAEFHADLKQMVQQMR